jgi:2',3'-cyclic-nucleotide 2'-phosphodiesterase (5'-nucleotidase family)
MKDWDAAVVLDSGDLFVTTNTLTDAQKEATLAKADLLVRSFNKQACKGVGIGDRDLGALGVAGLQELAKKAEFPFLCANLVHRKDNKPVFTPHVVVEAAGVKLGLFGLVTGGANVPEKDDYNLLPPVDAAKAQVKALEAAGVDAIILLAHLDQRDAQTVVAEVPGIDVVLGGQSMGSSRFLERMKDSWWVESGQKGKNVGIVVLNLTEGGKRPFVVREEAAKLKEELTALDSRIQRYVKLANGPERPGTRSGNKDRFKGVVSSLVRQRDELAAKAVNISKAAPDAPFLSLDMVGMSKKLRDHEETAKWVEEYKAKYEQKGNAAMSRRGTQPVSRATARPGRAVPHKAIRTLGPGTAGAAKGKPEATPTEAPASK